MTASSLLHVLDDSKHTFSSNTIEELVDLVIVPSWDAAAYALVRWHGAVIGFFANILCGWINSIRPDNISRSGNLKK